MQKRLNSYPLTVSCVMILLSSVSLAQTPAISPDDETTTNVAKVLTKMGVHGAHVVQQSTLKETRNERFKNSDYFTARSIIAELIKDNSSD